MNFCTYCGREGKYYFSTADKWCCESHYNKCPVNAEKLRGLNSEKNKTAHKNMMKNLARKGKRRCKYCNEIAKYWISRTNGKDIFCCGEKAKDCPGYKKWFSEMKKKSYRDNELYLEKQRSFVKALGKDNDVQQKKRDAMLKLHNNDDEKSKEYQMNFKSAHELRRVKNGN